MNDKNLIKAPVQEPVDKKGSPCPEFWDWLSKAYNFEGIGNFTKYNMEVAFLAGMQATSPPSLSPPTHVQEPVARYFEQWDNSPLQEIDEQRYAALPEDVRFKLYTTPPAAQPAQWQKVECPFCGDSVTATDMPAAQRQWVGLTPQEVHAIWSTVNPDWHTPRGAVSAIYEHVDAKLKEKNS